MEQALLKLEDAELGYRKKILGPLSFSLARGDFWGVVGPNGSGKTTLARTLLSLLPPVRGRLVREEGIRCAYAPQRHRLNPDYPLTAFEVALMGRTADWGRFGRPRAADRRRVEEEFSRLGISGLSGRLFRTLSGGQQQRVLIARVLAADPDVLVLDEPSEGMDLSGGADVLAFLRGIDRERRMGILLISHHLDDVISVANRLCLINHNTGLFETGPRDEMMQAQKLSQLYGRRVRTHECDGRVHIDVFSEEP